MSAASCGCPEDEGLVRHQRGTCTDPVVAKLGYVLSHRNGEARGVTEFVADLLRQGGEGGGT